MKIDERNALIERASTKKDGVYSYKGYLYVVKNNNMVAFADHFGDCYSCQGVFNVKIGHCEKYDRKKKLLEYLRES